MYDTHTVSEWLAMLSLASSGYAAFSAPYFLLVDADLKDFDPRPAARRALESPAADRVLVEMVNARLLLRDAAISVAALHMLLTARPEATR